VQADVGRGAWRLSVGTFAAILLHKPLEATPVSILATGRQAASRMKQIVNGSFALLCPLGVASYFVVMKEFPHYQLGILGCALAFSAGVFLCISLSDLLPELEFHAHDRFTLSLALMTGVVLAYAIV